MSLTSRILSIYLGILVEPLGDVKTITEPFENDSKRSSLGYDLSKWAVQVNHLDIIVFFHHDAVESQSHSNGSSTFSMYKRSTGLGSIRAFNGIRYMQSLAERLRFCELERHQAPRTK